MVFSSIPAYLDPANWPQQQNHPTGPSTGVATHQLPPPPPPPPPPPQPHGGGSTGTIRPGSMADRARMANIPMPEAALKCPRCESTNTKFCYFNNYSLCQPRHFCKTCRRYWTRGGALRNVPVGGGCRRNKRSKSSSSKSPVSGGGGGDRQTGSASTSTISSNSGNTTVDMLGLGAHAPPMRFMAPLHHFTEFGGAGGDMGLNYGPISGPIGEASELNFHMGGGAGAGAGAVSSLLSTGGFDQWRLQPAAQQFPFMGGLDSGSGLYQFEGGVEASGYGPGQVRPKIPSSGVSISQSGSVKMEESQEINLSRQFLGMNSGNDQFWGSTNAWTDVSGFSSSSTGNPL